MTNATIDLVEYLAGKGLQVHKAAGPEVTVHCPWCPDGDPKAKGKCYINVAEGLYHCKRCDARGNLRQLLAHYGDEPEQAEDPTDPAARRRVLAEATSFAMTALTNHDQLLLYLLDERGLTPETILHRRLGYVPPSWSLKSHLLDTGHKIAAIRAAGLLHAEGIRTDQDFLSGRLLIPYTSRGQILQLRGKEVGGKYLTGPGQEARLFDVDQLDDVDDVLVTEGEFDAMVVRQALDDAPSSERRLGVVAIPGAETFPKGWIDYFAHTKRVFVGLDPDPAGRKGTERIRQLLGHKARVVELPTDLPKCDWTEFVVRRHKTWRDVHDLVRAASGRRLWSVRDSRSRWARQRTQGGGLKLGYAGVDAAIEPGLLPGQVMIVLAKTGTGKTVTLSNLIHNLHTTPTLFVSLELTVEQVFEQLRRIWHFHHPHDSPDEMDQALAGLRICEENRLPEGGLEQLIDEYADERGHPPGLVLVDYLGYYARGARGHSPYEKTSNAVMELKAVAKARAVPIIAPHQVNRMAKEGKPIEGDEARDSGVVEETADFLLSLYRPDDAVAGDLDAEPSGKIRLSINKSRHGGKGRHFSLMFSTASLVLVDADCADARRAEHENTLSFQGLTYEDIRAKTPARQLHLVGGSA